MEIDEAGVELTESDRQSQSARLAPCRAVTNPARQFLVMHKPALHFSQTTPRKQSAVAFAALRDIAAAEITGHIKHSVHSIQRKNTLHVISMTITVRSIEANVNDSAVAQHAISAARRIEGLQIE